MLITQGQALVLQQIQLVAHARGWDIPKMIKKTRDALAVLEQVHTMSKSKEAPAPAVSAEDQALIAQAEEILKALQNHQDDPPDPPTPATPPTA